MLPSMLCHFQAIPSISSYSARPARQRARKKPDLSHCLKYLCTELALPNLSLGRDFHWQPVLKTKTMASNTRRLDIGLRPPPGFLWNVLPASLIRSGMNGSTRLQNSSDTSHDRIFAIPTSDTKCSMAASLSQFNYG